jgi:RNA polymerase sigma factor (TIGR02999 family)
VMERENGITEALRALVARNENNAHRLMPVVYEELRRIARRQLVALQPGHTLTTTGLVHEAYLKLSGRDGFAWRDRGHFFATAARAMRHILIDFAKSRRREKRGGGQPHLTFDETRLAVAHDAERLLLLDDALERLAHEEARLARVVECRFFGGLSDGETALALGVSERTVQRDWMRARSWLRDALSAG